MHIYYDLLDSFSKESNYEMILENFTHYEIINYNELIKQASAKENILVSQDKFKDIFTRKFIEDESNDFFDELISYAEDYLYDKISIEDMEKVLFDKVFNSLKNPDISSIVEISEQEIMDEISASDIIENAIENARDSLRQEHADYDYENVYDHSSYISSYEENEKIDLLFMDNV